ncbi:PEPxxWA-CTERM sorting domain-containing protein [Sandarakinorhabdus sp.]|uniref:PEPxxWA-CTERM sorting domain-containing protein n=1 Tax=Sandarakinorhabdus sp. TaxID=1916663 RepID=UPI003341DA6B
MMKHIRLLAGVTALATVAPAQAAVILDQFMPIVSNQVNFLAVSGVSDECTANCFFPDGWLLDDFTLSGTTVLTSVSALIFRLGAPNLGGIDSWQVGFFTSPSAALTSNVGDAGHASVAAGNYLTLAGPGSPYRNTAVLGEVTLPINVVLGPGSYWLGVRPRNSNNSSQVYVITSGGLVGQSGTVVGIQAGFQYNLPGGAFYRLSGTAVPEPASWAMLIAGFGLVGATARRRRISGVSASA